jgi:hypothetical protein
VASELWIPRDSPPLTKPLQVIASICLILKSLLEAVNLSVFASKGVCRSRASELRIANGQTFYQEKINVIAGKKLKIQSDYIG